MNILLDILVDNPIHSVYFTFEQLDFLVQLVAHPTLRQMIEIASPDETLKIQIFLLNYMLHDCPVKPRHRQAISVRKCIIIMSAGLRGS